MIRTNSESLSNVSTEFADEIIHGLQQTPKTISSKYFYDEVGDKIFQQIMGLPEYYLTNCEMEILVNQAEQIIHRLVSNGTRFNIVELGAGDGSKTKVLLKKAMDLKASFTYYPEDISPHVLQVLAEHMTRDLPGLEIKPIAKSYNDALGSPDWDQGIPTLMMFLGSSLGNFDIAQSHSMIKRIGEAMKVGDQLLIGLDLQKDPDLILAAYNDSLGVTREFNLNLLDRLNKELGANFVKQNFKHFPIYDPSLGAAKSYIVSKEDQYVHFKDMDQIIHFEQGEAIYTEISQKYKMSDIQSLATNNHFKILDHFFDQKKYYVTSLWEKTN